MDLGKWLRDRKKQVEGVVAQVNPFDGGKTYSSVTRRPTVDPFKSNNVNAKYGVLADKGRRDQFIQNNQRESFSTPIATFQSLRDIPGKIGNTLINNPIADKAADITGTNRQTSVEGRNSSDYLKPTGVIDNTVAAVSNLGQFNPIRSAGDIGQYLDTVSEKSRFKPVGDVIGNQTKDAANFGKPIEGSEWDARNLKNPVAKNAGEFSTMLGQTANFAVPVAGPLAIGGMVANEANELVNTARARGEDETIANLKGLLSGAGQAAVERYSSKLTTALPGSTKLAGLAKNKLIGIPASLAGGAITEGGEEFVQGLMGNAARGNDLTEGLKEQTIQGAKGGLLLGGFFGGANYAANRSQGTTQEAVQRVEQQNPTLQQTGIPAQPGSIRERIQQAKENVKSTIAETNQLLRQDDAGGYMGGTNAQDRVNGAALQAQLSKQDKVRTKQIHQDDQKIMTDFIDHARGITKLSPEQAQQLEYNASLVAEGYGLKMPNSNAKLANVFDKELQNQNYGKQLIKQDVKRDVAQQSYESARNKTIKVYRSGNIDSSRGAFFSSDRDLAGTYSTNPVKGDSGRSVNEYQINENTKLKKVSGGQLNFAKSIGIDVDSIKENIQKDYDSGKKFENDNNVQQETLMRVEDLIKDKLSKQGFDGVEYTGDYYGKKHQEYHLFNPTKSIKQDPAKAFVGDKDSVRRMELDYLKNNKGPSNSLQGEGNQAPINLDKDKKQSLLEKTRAAAKLLKQDDGGGYDGGRNAADRVRALEAENIDPLDSLKQEARTKTDPRVVDYNSKPKEGTIRLYTNTKGKNVDSILKEGLKTKQRLQGYGADPSEGSVSWFETTPNLKGYGGNTIAVDVPLTARMQKVNDTQYTVFDDLSPDNIVFVDKPLFGNYRTSDIKGLVDKYGDDKVREVFKKSRSKNITEKELDDILSATQPPKSSIDSLRQEARKYKSAEEFVKNNFVAHGTNKEILGNLQPTNGWYGKAVYTTDDLANASGRNGGGVTYFVNKPQGKLLEINAHGSKGGSGFTPQQYQDAIKNGYDGLKIKHDDGKTWYAMFNEQTPHTKQQLTDLYNQATKKKGFLSGLGEDGFVKNPFGKDIAEGLTKEQSDSPLTDKAYSETFGVSLEEAKKDITSINTSKTNPLDSVGMTEQEATRKLESNAPTMSPGNKKTKSLVDSMINDKKLTEAARIAQKEGKELNYFAKKDNNGRSVGIEEYNPSRQRIEAGFVVDNSTGKVLGNHIKVDATGTQINVGGEVVNISDVVGNPLDWKGDYEVSSTMERNIFKNAPNKEIAQKTYKFVVANKIQAEATLRKEIESQRKTLNQNVKDVQKVKPWSVSDKDFKADIFDFIENKKSQADIASKYGPKATQAILKYKNETRKLYDNLLDRANTELAKFGEKTIPKRSDYITHINELNQQPSFAGELMGQLQNSMLGEGYTTTRGSVPGDIAGRTENFSPRKRWNPFAQQRKGGEYTKDPFKAVDSYLEPTLYNIHMTESAVRARAVESAFRTAEILKNTEATKVSTDLDRELEKYKKQSNNAKLVSGFQEYANALAGKTQRWDRQVIDASKGTATALKGWQGLQRIGGRATILGNINSVLMQPLNQASVIAEVKLPNYIKGVASSLAGNNVEDKSPFIRARAAKIESAFRSKGQKVMDKAGIPLQFVELASVKLAWNAEYQQVLSEGLKGQDAIIEADRRTEKAVAGRGIADKPELYRSTLTNGLLQYTLEVNAQNKKFWRDLTPVQKGKFMAAAFGMNTVMEAVTGNKPLPDFLGAAIDTFRDFLDDDDDTPLENAGKGVQRFASEAVSMNPMLSAGANLLPDSTKKTLFGSDSDLTRFEGVPAPIGVIQNAVDVGKNVANGDVKKARDSALKLIPGGNQIRKTLQGKELIQDGGKYDKNGKLQYPAPESPLGKAQALLFGPSATKNAREYYDSMSAKLSGATDKLASLKKDSSGKTIDDFKTIAQSAFNTDKGKEFMALTNDDERKEFARQSSENRGIYDQYKAMQKSFSGGDDLLPSGISKESEKVLNKYDRLVAGTKDKIFEREKGAEYEYNKALYERDLLDGKLNEVDKIRRQKYLAKDKIGAQYEKPIRDTYSLSKAQIKQLVEGSEQGQKIYEQLVKYDQELYDAGLISYRKFKNGLASGRGGRGRDKKDTSLTDKYALQGQTLSRLQKLLAGTTFAGAETVTTPKTQKAKQKKITVNMKA